MNPVRHYDLNKGEGSVSNGMKRCLGIFIIIWLINLCWVFSLNARAAELEEMWEAMQQRGFTVLDFEVRVSDKSGRELADLVVDEIVVFQVSAIEPSTKTYTLLYAVEDQPVRLYKDISLPFILKRNFKGRAEGNYTITFGLRDVSGNIAKLSLTIRVKHKE